MRIHFEGEFFTMYITLAVSVSVPTKLLKAHEIFKELPWYNALPRT